MQANHGGGYQYRLCSADVPLTEECFQKTPLNFVGQQKFLWQDGTILEFDGTYVSEGTVPEGSMWVKNPLPRNDVKNTGKGFEPMCEENADCVTTANPYSKDEYNCRCSGMWGPYNL
jgi:hypothetical protein